MIRLGFFGVIALVVAGCAVPPPASPMERHARMAAAAEMVVQRCAGFAGGYGDARELRADANRNIVAARRLGATDADINKARQDVRGVFESAAIFAGHPAACNQLISELAWQAG